MKRERAKLSPPAEIGASALLDGALTPVLINNTLNKYPKAYVCI